MVCISTLIAWFYACTQSTDHVHVELRVIWGLLLFFVQTSHGFGDALDDIFEIAKESAYTEAEYMHDSAQILSIALDSNVANTANTIYRQLQSERDLNHGNDRHKVQNVLAFMMTYPSFWANISTFEQMVRTIRERLHASKDLVMTAGL